MRYDHLDMLPEQAFKKLGKQMTYEGGGKKGKKPPRLQLKPITTTTGFGSGYANPLTGQYGYTLDPRLAEMRDIFYGAANEFMPTEADSAFAQQVGQGGMDIYNRGSDLLGQALSLDTAQIGQDYYNDVRSLQSDARAAEEARLADTLFRTGRTGAATAYGGGYLNPEQFALLKAREEADRALAIQAEDLGRTRRSADTQYATGLQNLGVSQYGTGYQLKAMPYETMAGIFGLGTNIEGLGMSSMEAALMANRQQMEAQLALQQNAASRQKSGKGGKGGIGGLVSGGLQLASMATPAGGWSSLFSNPVSAVGTNLAGFGAQQAGYGVLNPLLGSNAWSGMDYSIGPRF